MSANPPAVPRVDPEVERSRETAARLLDAFARKLRRNRVVRDAAGRVGRAAHYVQAYSWKEMTAGIEKYARRNPVAAISLAGALGFVVGRALGRKIFR
ncbi:MAG TPA: hypothetical protein VKV17_22805 [Bryobacteraceae bacterium]|nr:hypothetical protein [Bryobacteraceae bacterium]